MNVPTSLNYKGTSSATRNENPLSKVVGMENEQERGGVSYFQGEKSKDNQVILASGRVKLLDREKSNSIKV